MVSRAKKFGLPDFLSGVLTEDRYKKWLYRKAAAHLRRDKNAGNTHATGAMYRELIHQAVCESKGLDAYTGETLDWSLISRFNNEAAELHGRKYKHGFAMLPTVDHVSNRRDKASFLICSWKTNDAKSDLDYEDFVELCAKVLAYAPQVRARIA